MPFVIFTRGTYFDELFLRLQALLQISWHRVTRKRDRLEVLAVLPLLREFSMMIVQLRPLRRRNTTLFRTVGLLLPTFELVSVSLPASAALALSSLFARTSLLEDGRPAELYRTDLVHRLWNGTEEESDEEVDVDGMPDMRILDRYCSGNSNSLFQGGRKSGTTEFKLF